MLDKNDLQQIKTVIDSSLEDFAIIVNNGFEEQRIYLETKFTEIDQRFDRIEGRLDKVEGRLDKVEGRLDKIEYELSGLRHKMDEFDSRLGAVERKIEALFKMESEDITAINKEVGTLEGRIFIIEKNCCRCPAAA